MPESSGIKFNIEHDAWGWQLFCRRIVEDFAWDAESKAMGQNPHSPLMGYTALSSRYLIEPKDGFGIEFRDDD